MKKLIAIFLLIITFVLVGSSLEQDQSDGSQSIYTVGETYEVNDMKITFTDCIYEDNKTTVIFDFVNNQDKERHFTFQTTGSEDYKSRYIDYASLTINGENSDERLAYGETHELQKENLYYINPLEKGTIIVIFNERLENTLDFTKDYYFYISGFLSSGVGFKDTRLWQTEGN